MPNGVLVVWFSRNKCRLLSVLPEPLHEVLLFYVWLKFKDVAINQKVYGLLMQPARFAESKKRRRKCFWLKFFRRALLVFFGGV